jgi:putative FmdB family regulatory protein
MYDYFCSTCNKTIERFRSVVNRQKAGDCPDCGKPMNLVAHPQDSAKPEGRAAVKDVFRKV